MGRFGYGPIWLWAEMTSDPADVSEESVVWVDIILLYLLTTL